MPASAVPAKIGRSWFDTAVNAHLVEQGALDFEHGEVIGLVVETGCSYFP